MDKNNKKLELTVPAGGMEQLVAAVNAGADSVYLGYKKFGARAYADNFDLNQLRRAVNFAHGHNVKVYLALNTLIKDDEIEEVIEFLEHYTGICNDGIIIQDFCLYKIIKDLFKNMPLHASTQLNLHNTYSLKMVNRMGFKRVVLAREMTIEEIKNLCKEELAKIEMFVHGSQCYSYSGSCYFSSFIGGRSGNRGRCTQPCRMKYKLLEKTNLTGKYVSLKGSYLLSKNDLCLLEFLPEIAEAGVSALKIEGRMKPPEYVGIVTKIYRKYIDMYYKNPVDYRVDVNDIYKLTQVFSREMGQGYIKNKYPSDIISINKSGSMGNFLGRVYKVEYENIKSKKIKNIYIKSRWEINNGDIIEIWTKRGNSRIKVKDLEVVNSDKMNKYRYKIELDGLKNILEKDRVFKYFDNKISRESWELFKYGMGKNIPIENGTMKNNAMVNKNIKLTYLKNFFNNYRDIDESENRILLKARVYDHSFLECSIKNGIKELIYSNFSQLTDAEGLDKKTMELLKRNNETGENVICVDTPQILYDDDFSRFGNNILKLLEEGINNFRISNPGVLEFLMELNKDKSYNINIHIGCNFNIFNTPSIFFLDDFVRNNLVFKDIELSLELNLKEISRIILNVNSKKSDYQNKLKFSIFGHGSVQIMNSRYKLKFITGEENKSKFYIEDIKGYRFPVSSDYNQNMMIFNSKNICTLFDLDRITGSGVNKLIIDSRFYSLKDFSKILRNYREALNILHFKGANKFKSFTSYLKNDTLFSNYSRGHLFRGVE